MGNSIQNLAEGVSLLASAKTWIEGKAIQQLQTTAKLPAMKQVVGMPDLHPGRGYPVGAAFFSVGHFYPALIGNDIGCGMGLWQTSLDTGKLSQDKLEKRLGNIDTPLDEDWQQAKNDFAFSGFANSLGTIGGGNHFAELQSIDSIYDAEALQTLGLNPRQLLLLVHSGSRGMGEMILRQHIDQFGHHGLPEGSIEAAAYLQQHQQALDFAKLNRQLIAKRILEKLHAEGKELLDLHHNLLSESRIGEQKGWLHRKGAAPSDSGLVVIPGSRGDFTYLLEPIADESSLYSLAHGAGRKWMRSDCKERLDKRFSRQQLLRTNLGSRVICADRHLLYEEAPEAYKPVSSIIESLQEAGLVRLLARLKPVLTYKTQREAEQ